MNDALMLPPGIIVMGPYRCATSFLSHLLERRGVSFGPSDELYEADQWNPYGYYQRPDVLRANDDFFVSAGHHVFDPADLPTLRARGDVGHLRKARLDWRLNEDIWGLKDPRFCATLMSWFAAGLLGRKVGLIHLHRDPLASARSLLQHPELAAQLAEPTLDAALTVIVRYDELAQEQESAFPGPVLSLHFDEVITDPDGCAHKLDGFIASLISSATEDLAV